MSRQNIMMVILFVIALSIGIVDIIDCYRIIRRRKREKMIDLTLHTGEFKVKRGKRNGKT